MARFNARDRFAMLPEARQKAIKARRRRVDREDMSLAELREARQRSQVELAQKLGIKQAAVFELQAPH